MPSSSPLARGPRFARSAVLLVALALGIVVSPAAAQTADIGTVATEVQQNGFYADPGVDEAAISRAVADARNAGLRLMVVVLRDEPPGGATTYADTVYDTISVDGLVLVVAPETVGVAGDPTPFDLDSVNAALDAALEASSDEALVATFVSRLTGADVPGAVGSGGGGSFLPIVLIGLLVVGGVWWYTRSRRSKQDQVEAKVAAAKAEVQQRIDAAANDILDMAEEVRLSGNEAAQDHYEKASAIYGDVAELFEKASTPEELIALATRLDEAIWHLDATEALLDGKPVPPKPEPPRPEIAPRREAAPTREPVGSGSRPVPSPESYRRRPTRRSSYGGMDLLDILIGVGSVLGQGGGILGGRRRGRRGGGMFGGGGGILGGGRSSRRSSGGIPGPRSSGRSSRSRSRSGSRRIRTGRRRR